MYEICAMEPRQNWMSLTKKFWEWLQQINTGCLADNTTRANNNSINVNTSANVRQDKSIGAKMTVQPFSANHYCCNEPPNMNSPQEEAAAVNNYKCPMPSNGSSSEGATVQTEWLGTNSGLIGTVQGHAIVWSSWRKSGCKQQCCFPNNLGLHRSSIEAFLDTEAMQILIWCHVNKCESSSLTRTWVAAVAFVAVSRLVRTFQGHAVAWSFWRK